MKNKFFISTIMILWILSLNFSFWASRKWSPKDIVDSVNKEANKWGSWVQNTQLNNINGNGVKETLTSLKDQLAPYIQWAVVIGLSIAVIAIIFNGLMLVTWSIKDSQVGKVKTRMIRLTIWILVLTGFYFIIRVLLSIIWTIT